MPAVRLAQNSPFESTRHSVISGACALGLFFHCATAPCAPGADTHGVAAIDACALLQRAEISQAIGAPVGEPARTDSGLESNGSYSSSCVWEIEVANPAPPRADAPLGGKSFVILNAVRWPRGSGRAHLFLDSFRDAAQNGDIPGQITPRNFGDEALWWGDGLAVRKRDVSFGLSVFSPGSKLNRTGTLEARLAPRILERLERLAKTNERSKPRGDIRRGP